MTDQAADDAPSLAATAAEPTDESIRREREAVGDGPDTGGVVPEEKAQ